MAPTFSKEAILQGSIDHLCLVCESYLRSERDVCLHVSTPEHRQNLDSTDYVEKYTNDRVRKVKKSYYCEFCNVLVSTITKVRLHVEELGHKENVASQLITRVDDVVYSGNISISDEAWHGFIDENTCIICNEEFDDKDDHKNESSHIINLIQNKLINDFKNSYRKIDDTTFQCLTCNEVVAEMSDHLEDVNHKNLLQKCIKTKPLIPQEGCKERNTTVAISPQSINEIEDVENTNDRGNKKSCKMSTKGKPDVKIITPTDNNNHIICDQKSTGTKINKHTPDILDLIPKFQKENININLESRTAMCKKCSVMLEFDSKIIDHHIQEHKHDVQKKAKETTPVLFEKDANKLRVENNITENEETKSMKIAKQKKDTIQKLTEEHDLAYTGNKLYCRTCNKNIPISETNILEHVNGESHKNKAKLSSKPTHSRDNENKKTNTKKHKLQRVPLHQFVRNVTSIKNMFADDVVINEKYCINHLSLLFLTMTSSGHLRCIVCEVNVLWQDVKDHLLTKRHQKAINEIPLIIHTESEFIREIRSEIYHCGFCNIIDTWEGMENHLKSTSHRESKTFANWRLTQYLPQIHIHNMNRRIENEFLIHLMFSEH